MSILDDVKQVVISVLQLNEDATGKLAANSLLLGGIPEFDSMSVVGVLTALEERYDISIDDDEVDGEIFETLGSLSQFVERKLEE